MLFNLICIRSSPGKNTNVPLKLYQHACCVTMLIARLSKFKSGFASCDGAHCLYAGFLYL